MMVLTFLSFRGNDIHILSEISGEGGDETFR